MKKKQLLKRITRLEAENMSLATTCSSLGSDIRHLVAWAYGDRPLPNRGDSYVEAVNRSMSETLLPRLSGLTAASDALKHGPMPAPEIHHAGLRLFGCLASDRPGHKPHAWRYHLSGDQFWCEGNDGT